MLDFRTMLITYLAEQIFLVWVSNGDQTWQLFYYALHQKKVEINEGNFSSPFAILSACSAHGALQGKTVKSPMQFEVYMERKWTLTWRALNPTYLAFFKKELNFVMVAIDKHR